MTEAEPSIGDFGNFQSKFPPGADEFKSRLAAPSIGDFDYYYVGVHTYVRERHSDVIKTSISFRPSLGFTHTLRIESGDWLWFQSYDWAKDCH